MPSKVSLVGVMAKLIGRSLEKPESVIKNKGVKINFFKIVIVILIYPGCEPREPRVSVYIWPSPPEVLGTEIKNKEGGCQGFRLFKK